MQHLLLLLLLLRASLTVPELLQLKGSSAALYTAWAAGLLLLLTLWIVLLLHLIESWAADGFCGEKGRLKK
jgi:hypothetical protein